MACEESWVALFGAMPVGRFPIARLLVAANCRSLRNEECALGDAHICGRVECAGVARGGSGSELPTYIELDRCFESGGSVATSQTLVALREIVGA